MASKKQLAWRKKFAKMAKAGKFKKKTSKSEKRKAIKKRIKSREKIYHDEKKGWQFGTRPKAKAWKKNG